MVTAIRNGTKPADGIGYEVVIVTPVLARAWLSMNGKNRQVSEATVRDYAGMIERGEWLLTGEPILLDREGHLINGQHRLMAVILAGQSIEVLVVRNVDPAAMLTIDTGKRRTFADYLSLDGHKDVNNLASAATWVWRYHNNCMYDRGEHPSRAQLKEVLDNNPGISESLRRVSVIAARALGASTSLLAGVHFLLATQSGRAAADQFIDDLVNGSELSANNPIFILREKLIAERALRRRAKRGDIAAVIIRAFNAWYYNKPLKRINFPRTEQKGMGQRLRQGAFPTIGN